MMDVDKKTNNTNKIIYSPLLQEPFMSTQKVIYIFTKNV